MVRLDTVYSGIMDGTLGLIIYESFILVNGNRGRNYNMGSWEYHVILPDYIYQKDRLVLI